MSSPGGRVRVDRGRRRDDVEGKAVVRCEHRQRVRTDLVGGVAVRRDPVGADEHAVDQPGSHQPACRSVDDHGVRDTQLAELPCRQPCALEQRARLVDPHVLDTALLVGRAHGPERRAVAARRETAGVAVRESATSRVDQLRRVERHAPAALDLVAVDLTRPLGRIVGRAHLLERPGEVDGRRPGRREDGRSPIRILAVRHRERVAVRGGDPDRGRAPYREGADRIRDLFGRAALELHLLVGQSPLVEHDDAVRLETDDALRLQFLPHSQQA